MQNGPGFLMRAVHPPSSDAVLAENIAETVSPRLWSFGSLVSTWGYRCACSLRHWDPCLWLPPNGCLASIYPLGCQPKSVLKMSAGLSTSLQYFQKFYLHCVKLILRCFSRICLTKIQQTMLEKRAAAVMWVHAESDNLYHVLLHPMECCQPYNKVAITCLVVFVSDSFIMYRVGSWETPGSQLSTLGYYREMLLSNISIFNFLSKLLHLQY